MSLSSMSTWDFANVMMALNMSSEIVGKKSTISNLGNLHLLLFGILYNHQITEEVLRHWLKLLCDQMVLLIFSRICSLTISICNLAEFIRRHLRLLGKFSLWSFMVTKAFLSENRSILLSSWRSLAIVFASLLMALTVSALIFLYLAVVLSFNSLL